MARKLEEYRLFPVAAWILVFAFAAFTFSLTYRLTDDAGLSGELQVHKATTQDYIGQ